MIELLASIAIIAYCVYKSLKNKSFRLIYAGFLVLSIQLTKEPFHLSYKYSLGILALLFGSAHLFEYTFKRKIKDAYIFSLIFYLLGLGFFLLRLQ